MAIGSVKYHFIRKEAVGRSISINSTPGIELVYTNIICKLCSVWNCMSDLIVNVALEPLYIHEEGEVIRHKGVVGN